MNIFQIHWELRDIGPGYGLPVIQIDFGPGVNLDAEKALQKCITAGLSIGTWVVLRKPLNEKGIALFVQGLITCRAVVEVEDNGAGLAPPWFTNVARWIVDWKIDNNFNYGALRGKQDMIILRSKDISMLDRYLLETNDLNCLKAVVVNEDKKKEVFERVKEYGVRVYVK